MPPELPILPDSRSHATAAARDERQPYGVPPGTIILQPPKSGLLGKIGMGLLCSTIVTVVMYFMQLKMFIIHVLAFIVALFGGRHYDVKTREENGQTQASAPGAFPGSKLLDKVQHLVEDKAKQAKEAAATPLKEVAHKTSEKVQRAEKAVAKTRDDAFRKLDDMKEARARAQAEAEAAEKKHLLARAAELRLKADADTPLFELRRAVAEAEQKTLLAQWRKRYNASCPFCHFPMKVSTRGRGQVRCQRCFNIFGEARARAFPPPMPRNFRGF